MKILLIGMPNVGKSVIFNKLTGINAGVANYAGTTVELSIGKMKGKLNNITVIDVPGTYTLSATNEAEKVASDMLNKDPDAVICVIDANNIESSIYLLLQVMERNLPIIAVLNRVDIAQKKNLLINTNQLSKDLGISVIPMIATKGVGLDKLTEEIDRHLHKKNLKNNKKIRAEWNTTEAITHRAISVSKDKTSSSGNSKLERLIVSPFPGIFIALFALIFIFSIVIGLGMSLRRFILLPIFRGYVFPIIVNFIENIFTPGFLRNILIGDYGFLIKGIEWPITLVLPYVFSFYLALSILEDSGYLPRLGILLDGILNKFGLSGANIIPIILGYGCTIPAITSTRAMNTKKERLIVVTMVTLAVPCISQTGVFISLLAENSILVVLALFTLSFTVAGISGFITNLIIKGPRYPLTLVEVPVLLSPDLTILGKKIWIRIKSYLTGGAVMMFYAIFATSILYETGFFQLLGNLMAPIVESWLRLPKDASIPLMLGIVRRELAVLPLLEMDLTSIQLFVGSVVALFYVPCIAVIAMIAKEFGLKISVLIFLITMIVSFLAGGIIANLYKLFF